MTDVEAQSEKPDVLQNKLTKQQLAKRVGVVPRTIQRRISDFISEEDSAREFLWLYTSDGEICQGTSVTPGMVSKLNDEKKQPEWYIDADCPDEVWSKKRRKTDQKEPIPQETTDPESQLPAADKAAAAGEGDTTTPIDDSIPEAYRLLLKEKELRIDEAKDQRDKRIESLEKDKERLLEDYDRLARFVELLAGLVPKAALAAFGLDSISPAHPDFRDSVKAAAAKAVVVVPESQKKDDPATPQAREDIDADVPEIIEFVPGDEQTSTPDQPEWLRPEQGKSKPKSKEYKTAIKKGIDAALRWSVPSFYSMFTASDPDEVRVVEGVK